MRSTNLMGLFLLCGVASCTAARTGTRAASISGEQVQYAPRTHVEAELPGVDTGGNQMQGHGGPVLAFGAAPPLHDVGSEQMPDFPTGAEPPIKQGRFEVIMPNGGNRPVESVNSLASPP